MGFLMHFMNVNNVIIVTHIQIILLCGGLLKFVCFSAQPYRNRTQCASNNCWLHGLRPIVLCLFRKKTLFKKWKKKLIFAFWRFWFNNTFAKLIFITMGVNIETISPGNGIHYTQDSSLQFLTSNLCLTRFLGSRVHIPQIWPNCRCSLHRNIAKRSKVRFV